MAYNEPTFGESGEVYTDNVRNSLAFVKNAAEVAQATADNAVASVVTAGQTADEAKEIAEAAKAYVATPTDDRVASLVRDAGSVTGAALSATYAARRLVTNPRHLRRWYGTDLPEAGAAQKHITVVGDSIAVGAYAGGTTAGDWRKSGFVAQLRRVVAARYGDVGPGHAKFEEDDRMTASGGSTSSTTGPLQKGRQLAAGNTWTMATDAPCTGFVVTYWQQGGAFTWAVDGGSATTVTPAGGTDQMTTVTISGLSDATHTLVLTGVGTAHIGTIRPLRGTASGIVVNRFGRSGATTEHAAMGAGTAANRTRMLDATFKATGTDLAVIALGANDVTGGITPATFRANLKLMTDYVAALGGCSLLVAGPRYADSTIQDSLYAQALDLANTDDHVAYIDLMDVWGDYATVTQADLDFMHDSIHPNSAGHLSYGHFIADAILQAQPVL